jgi:DNA-binding NtrC family response regulator
MTKTKSQDGVTRTLDEKAPHPGRRIQTYRLNISSPDERTVEVSAPLLRVGTRKGNDLVVEDPTVSRLHFEIVIDGIGHRLRDLGSTNGTYVDGYRVTDIYLKGGSVIRAGRVELAVELLDEETSVPASSADRFGPVIGQSLAMRELFSLLERASASDATILVEGETGTGKELISQAIHEVSPRRTGPFVVFDCGAVAPSLLESELFGHEKGAFTGASTQRIGRMEEAHGGTLFIDEVGELPAELQPRLLRAIETREVRRLGGSRTIPTNVRIVAATNRDLSLEVNRGSFREDLYYRLAVVRVVSPPLRDRPEDIEPLAEHFIQRACGTDRRKAARLIKSVSEANWKLLRRHPWPGNVRELRNVIERTVALSAPETLESIEPAPGPKGPKGSGSLEPDLDRPLMEQKADLVALFEEAYLRGQLDRHQGNITRAAAAAGLDRMYFKRLLKKYQG